MDISKKDWKLFREKLPDWQENYMDKLNKQYIELLSNEKETASDKFWELAKRIKNDRKNPGVIMDMRKSEAIWNIINLIRLNVITHDDEKFWTLEKRIKKDKKDCGVQCEMSRSIQFYIMLSLLNEGAITMEDLEDFSDDLKQAVDFVLWRSMD